MSDWKRDESDALRRMCAEDSMKRMARQILAPHADRIALEILYGNLDDDAVAATIDEALRAVRRGTLEEAALLVDHMIDASEPIQDAPARIRALAKEGT